MPDSNSSEEAACAAGLLAVQDKSDRATLHY